MSKAKKEKTKRKEKKIGHTDINSSLFSVFSVNALGNVLYKNQGYVCVGENNYLAVKQSRVPFLTVFLPMVAGVVACLVMIIIFLTGQTPMQEGTYYPLPPIDPNIQPIVTTTVSGGDGPDTPAATTTRAGGESPDIPIDPTITTKPNSTTTTAPVTTTKPQDKPDTPAGSVSLIYTMVAKYDAGDDGISMYFKNPSKSSHDALVELYAVATDGSLVLMARSGRIPAGYGIEQMTLQSSAPTLAPGSYEGLYRVLFYDPVTGEKANVDSKITGITIAVK